MYLGDMDSPMTSSPGPGHEEDDLFPSTHPATPSSSQAPQNLELSPPETQEDIEQARSSMATGEGSGAGQRPTSKTSRMLSKKTEAGEEHGISNNPNSRNYKPGEIWKNKKALEEYRKVMDNLADEDFSLGRRLP